MTTDILGGTPDGAPCGGDVTNYRKPGQTPIGVGADTANCTFRQAINFCYSQVPWASGVAACIVRFPKMNKFVLKAPIFFDPAAHSAFPLTIVLDARGATISPPASAAGLTGPFFSTNTTRQPLNSAQQSSRRRLASIAQQPADPFEINMRSGFEIANCTLIGFGDPGRLGGAIRAENLASFRLTNVILKNNFASRGGGIYLANVKMVAIRNTQFIVNSASTSGGGAFVVNSTTVLVKQSHFEGNVASVVGAGLVVDHAFSVSVEGSSFTNNKATGFAGGVSLNDVYGSVYSRIVNSTFVSNRAYYGPMLAMGRVRHVSIDGNEFRKNTAVRGCGIFWIRGTGMVSPRNLLNNMSNLFELNSAPYGPNYGTEGLYMVAAPRVVSVVDYTAKNQIDATAQVLDFYGQLIDDDASTASVAMKKDSVPQCRFNNLKVRTKHIHSFIHVANPNPNPNQRHQGSYQPHTFLYTRRRTRLYTREF